MSSPTSTYRELPPPAALARYLVCVWEQRIGDAGRPYEQPVFPDGCIDLVADDSGIVVAGPATTPVVAPMSPRSTTVGLRIRPGSASMLLATSAQDLLDRTVSFDDVWGRHGATVADRSRDATSTGRIDVLTDFVVSRLSSGHDADRQVATVASLLADQPAHPLESLCAATDLSPRQLRRRVVDAVGYPPRMLAGILRFQRFLRAARAATPDGRDLARLAVESGYADQPHLTREFRRFTGSSPAALLDDEDRRLDAARPERSRRNPAA